MLRSPKHHVHQGPAAPRPWLTLVLGGLLAVVALYELGELAGSGGRRLAAAPTEAASKQHWCPDPAIGGAFPTTPFPANFWFVKTVKTGSSTLTSVFNSICQHYGIMWVTTDDLMWKVRVMKPLPELMGEVFRAIQNNTDADYLAVTDHVVFKEEVAAAFPQKPLLFTAVRHPLARLHSHFIQNQCSIVARQMGWDPKLPVKQLQPIGPNMCDLNATFLEEVTKTDTLPARWEFARSQFGQNFIYQYVRGNAATVPDALKQYNFVFVAERMNEGLVLFMLEYGLTYEDIAYLPLKQRTGKYKTTEDMPKELNDFILASNQLDLQLWEAANQRLDQARTKLEHRCGAGLVEAALAAFEWVLEQVAAECSDYTAWYEWHGFSAPYTYTGFAETAFDSGTAYRCVRHVARRYMLGRSAPAAGVASGSFLAARRHMQIS